VGGGGGHFAEDVCRHLARRGHDIRVVTSRVPGLPALEARDGYCIYRYWCLRRFRHTCTIPEMAAFIVLTMLPTLRQACTFKPDVMHVHFAVPTGVPGWLIHQVTGIPYVLSAHLGDIPGGVPEQTDKVFRWIMPFTVPIWRAAAAVTVANDYFHRLALQSYQTTMTIVPTGLDLEEITPSPMTPRLPVRLIFPVRFNPQKNPLFVVELLTRVTDLDWRLEVVGDGPLLPTFRDSIQAAGLAGRTAYHGWVAPPELEALLSQSDLLLMPSLMEGTPVVGMRALGAGLAILGSDVGGIPDVIQNGGNGYLCAVNDLEAFAARLREMLSQPDRLMSMKAASRQLASRFDLKGIADKLEQIFLAVVTTSKK
jgi:glycosyltransferase involved in cell wall biosynthesis